ncbi:hypothetical protein ASD67_20270 [Sphingopyxis sp. Root1497]|uniref:hypothetical protein n=1 Tax=Sphingopyxis sp. Root1497 TaxID=1736474 RepID=UPI0006F4F447|nr:hypothetical protein [Sphingopyxis sp. Root1497]KQZ61546.1 hypothetical protein ASD67_20270 [Sphingopyxis sp. Root1497]
MTRIILPSLLILALAACGSEPSGKTTTKLEAVEVEPGTISDSMIILDNASGDGTAVDNSVPDDGTAKPAQKDEQAADQADAEETSGEGEAITVPVGKKADTPAPAKKAGE